MWLLISPTLVWRAELRCWFCLDGGRSARNSLVCRRAVRSQIVSQFISKSSRQDSVSHPTRKWCGTYIQPRPVGRWSWQPAKELVNQPTNWPSWPSQTGFSDGTRLASVFPGWLLLSLIFTSHQIPSCGLIGWRCRCSFHFGGQTNNQWFSGCYVSNHENIHFGFWIGLMKSPLRHLQQPRLWLARLPPLLRSTCPSLWRRLHFCDSDFGPETPLMERWGRFC